MFLLMTKKQVDRNRKYDTLLRIYGRSHKHKHIIFRSYGRTVASNKDWVLTSQLLRIVPGTLNLLHSSRAGPSNIYYKLTIA